MAAKKNDPIKQFIGEDGVLRGPLGFAPGPQDERDYEARPKLMQAERAGALRTSGDQLWLNPRRLNQGEQGACVGGGWTGWKNSYPVPHDFGNEELFATYELAKTLDEWAGENYSGTSVRAGAKACQQQGHLQTYGFIKTYDELLKWLLNYGPVVIGVNWREGMDEPTAADDWISRVRGVNRGGHCVVLDGTQVLTTARNPKNRGLRVFELPNTWGESWGNKGRARFTEAGLRILIAEKEFAGCVALEIA